jgi:hypothetical protein
MCGGSQKLRTILNESRPIYGLMLQPSAEWIVLAIYNAAESLAGMPYKGRAVGEAEMRELTLRDIR